MIKRTPFAAVTLIWLCGLSIAALADKTPPTDKARRIVSFNLCADQLLLALADPEQVAGLSPYAADASMSVMADKASRYPRLNWDTESVVNLAPDMVLIGPSNRPIRAILDATGVRIAAVNLVSTLAAARQQAREVGAAIGHPERGEALARQLEEAEARLRAAAGASRTALVVDRSGYTEGPASLAAAMLTVAGLRPPPNAPSRLVGYFPLEHLIINGPDVLVMQDPPREASDQGALFLTHPALLARYGPERRINLPARYTLCGGPALLQGLNYLTDVIKAQR